MSTRRVLRSRHITLRSRPHSAAQLGLPYELYGDQVSQEPSTALDTGAGSVSSGSIVQGGLDAAIALTPGTVAKANLVGTMAAPEMVTVKPTLPDALYPIGSLIVFVGDGTPAGQGDWKLYRNVGDVWTAEVDTSDLVGKINGSILEAESVLAGHILAGEIKTDHLSTGAVTAAKIFAGAVTADALAAQVVLAKTALIAGPSTSGARTEMDKNGVRGYDSDNVINFNVPTDAGIPLTVRGEVLASKLTSTEEFRIEGTAVVDGGSVITLAVGVQNPLTAPIVSASPIPLNLTSNPGSWGEGIAWDSGNTSYWLAADPSAGSYVAHEYDADGTYLRSIPRNGTTGTATDEVGSKTHVADTTDATSGTTWSQISTPLTMPRAGRVTMVSAYLAGYGGACTVKNSIWNSSGTRLATTASYTAASRTFSNGNDVQYNKALTSPLTVTAGQVLYVGFQRTSSGDGFFWSKDDGSGKTTYKGNGLDGAFSEPPSSTDSDSKPNVYITYEYDTSTLLENTKMVGVATDGTYVYTLGANGIVYKYNRSTLAYVAQFDASSYILGTKANAGLFSDGSYLYITTCSTTGTGYIRLVRLNLGGTGAPTYSTSIDLGTATVNGSTAVVRGGHIMNDALNANTSTYWIAVNSVVNAYRVDTGAAVANRSFGSASWSTGICHNGSEFVGRVTASPTILSKFTGWDWTSESSLYWVAYSWYDSVVPTYETALSPKTSITMSRRLQMSVTTPVIPVGGSDNPNRVRVYMERNASTPTTLQLQCEDTLLQHTYASFNTAGGNSPTSNSFPSSDISEIKSMSTGWSLKGDGTVAIDASKPIGGKPPVVQKYFVGGSTVWTKPAGISYIVVECQAAGGGGGGVDGVTNEAAAAGGGGGGGYARKIFTAYELSFLTNSQASVSVGSGGSGGSAGNNAGGTGGNSSFSGTGITTVLATGGGGGNGMLAAATQGNEPGGAGGSYSGADIGRTGDDGGMGIRGGSNYYSQGFGGGSFFGGQTGGNPTNNGGGGYAGSNYGGGGSGAHVNVDATNYAGGAGGPGVVIITEYYGA